MVLGALALACSSSGSHDPSRSGGGDGTGDGGGSSAPGKGPAPGEAPIITPIAPGGVDESFQVPEFPQIFGANFGGTDFPSSTCREHCTDFPSEPLLDSGGGPINPAELAPFADPDAFSAGNLCVVEPQLSSGGTPGALFPANWLRPRFRWQGGGNNALYEVRLHNEIEVNDLVAYTRQTQWVMPAGVWRNLARNVHTPITVTVRAASGATLSGMRGTFQIAPVNAGGSLVFWATTSSEVAFVPQVTSQLLGFRVGDEGVIQALDATDIQLGGIVGEDGIEPRGNYDGTLSQRGLSAGKVACVGCHISTPDGAGVVFSDNWPWNKVVASITEGSVGATPAWMSDGAALLLSQPWLGTQTMSPAHFRAGDRLLLTSYGLAANGEAARAPWDARFAQGTGPARHGLAWFDLEAQVAVADRSEVGEFAPSNDYTNSFTYPTEPVDLQRVPPNPPGQGQLDRRQLSLFRAATVAGAQGSGWDLIATTGETRSAVTPDWSNDGAQIAYVSTDVTSPDGHPDWTANAADIKLVPFNGGDGGRAVNLPGASDPNFLEYYPSFSSDDAFIAFARAPNPSNPGRTGCTPTSQPGCRNQNLGANPDGPYYNRNGEIYIVPSTGAAQPIRLAANDPVACTSTSARGSINSWPKWSPRVIDSEGKSYYFLVFSSARAYPGSFTIAQTDYTPPISNTSSQLYMASIVVDDATGDVTTYPAIYIWNQNTRVNADGSTTQRQTSNLTPAWDEFILPPIVIQ
ncbi:MAG TPA: hypothetical protein VFS67_00165 [Polyangiaceae bacterium]|nr:hypothetical protein [Polyangiaceae bacterium]